MLGFLLGELKEVSDSVNGGTHGGITQKFKMVAVKPEIHVFTFVDGISMLLYMIATKFQRLYPCFWV